MKPGEAFGRTGWLVACACLWLGSQVEIFRLKENAQKLIGRAFIGTALAAVVLAFRGVFSK